MGQSSESEECEDFFSAMDENLAGYFNQSVESFTEDELEAAYPIQSSLKKLSEKYEVHESLGKGGMKNIFRVFDREASRWVAMAKILKEPNKENTERFFREARLTASLQHPNIVPVYEIGLDDQDQAYFTMELLKGQSLADVIKDSAKSDIQKYDINHWLDLFARICDAMEYAHSRGVIHLDLKPENIQLGEYGEVLVFDWGLARILTEDDLEINEGELDPNELNDVTLAGKVKGTPGYMAPEQIQLSGSKDVRSDIYSLGSLLYVCLTGQIPVEGNTVEEVLDNTQRGKLMLPSERLSKGSIPAGLEALILKALSRDPEGRYQSVNHLRQDIEKYRHGFATQAQEASLWEQLSLLMKRHKKSLLLTALFLICFTTLIIVSFTRVKQERNEALKAKEKAQELQTKAEDNLQLFMQEQKLNEQLKKDLEGLFDEVVGSDDLSSARKKIALLEEGLKRGSARNPSSLWRRKALLHTVIQDFEKALECLTHVKPSQSFKKMEALVRMGLAFRRENNDGKKNLSDSQIAKLLSNLGNSYSALSLAMYDKHMRFNKKYKRDLQEYCKLATVVLNICNNIWDKERAAQLISYEAGKLDLRNRAYRYFCVDGGYGLNILEPFKINQLDIAHTAFFEFAQLRGLKFKELNISGCKVNEINPGRVKMIKSFGIKKVIYDSRFLKPAELDLLKNNFETEDEAIKKE